MAPESNDTSTVPNNFHQTKIPHDAAIASTAWIGSDVELASGVVVGPASVIGFSHPQDRAGKVYLGRDSYVAPHVHVDTNVEIGKSARIETGSYIGSGSRIGNETLIGPHCTIVGDCEIQDYASLAAEVYVCTTSVLEAHCQLMPGVKLLDHPCPPLPVNIEGPRVAECAVVGVNAIIWSGVRIGRHSIVAAGCVVKNDVQDYTLVQGSPARPVCDIRWIRTRIKREWVYPYPWIRYYTEGEDITVPSK
jgi:UDP-3-O-[3-hydroxymyristoyl] glucosamine N-acyltransferase